MQILLLSGGSGKRLWPLSNNSRSKQFIKLLNSPDGQKESMVQRVIRQLGESDLKGHVLPACLRLMLFTISWVNTSM